MSSSRARVVIAFLVGYGAAMLASRSFGEATPVCAPNNTASRCRRIVSRSSPPMAWRSASSLGVAPNGDIYVALRGQNTSGGVLALSIRQYLDVQTRLIRARKGRKKHPVMPAFEFYDAEFTSFAGDGRYNKRSPPRINHRAVVVNPRRDSPGFERYT